ncbi:MAG: cell division protein FtsA [Candidatus Berkelbacteria bacterium]|nr:MAG: cell division protein FtsA [Candidatus Berkelbacteria bacterium]QQG51412.1 MAG: cell division protein FtsA [Candidatus Berkelbacteria bacterium]
MTRDNLIVGVDIGTSKIAVCVGTMNEGVMHIVGVASVNHNGLRKGVVTDIEETVSALSHALEEAERMAGSSLAHAYIGVSGNHIETMPAKGVVAVSKPNGEIDASDVARVIDAAKTVALPQNRELIHVFPHHFVVDGHEDVRDPIGMNGIRLEVEALIISSSASALRNLIKTVDQAGLEIDGVIFAPLATAKAITTKSQRETGVVVIDLGAGSTNMAVFEEGELLHAASLPIGSKHITNDIAIGLRKNLDVAEAIKLKYGSCIPENIRETETINLSVLDPAEDEKVSRRHVAEIIEARISEIFQMVKEELQRIGKDGLLPAGAVFTGAGASLEDLCEQARKQLRLPAELGFPTAQMSGMIDKIDNPIYATSVGLVLWGMDEGQGATPRTLLDFGKLGGVLDRFRGILRNFTN